MDGGGNRPCSPGGHRPTALDYHGGVPTPCSMLTWGADAPLVDLAQIARYDPGRHEEYLALRRGVGGEGIEGAAACSAGHPGEAADALTAADDGVLSSDKPYANLRERTFDMTRRGELTPANVWYARARRESLVGEPATSAGPPQPEASCRLPLPGSAGAPADGSSAPVASGAGVTSEVAGGAVLDLGREGGGAGDEGRGLDR